MSNVKSIVTVCEDIKDFLHKREAVLQVIEKKDITANEIVNDDINRTPWIGIYPSRNAHSLQPYALGNGSWLDTLKTDIVIQAATLDGFGKKAITELESIVVPVTREIIDSKRIDNTVRRVMDIQVEYTYMESESKVYFPTAIMTVTMETT